MPEAVPHIDGVPICTIIEIGEGGLYKRIGRTSLREARRSFTVFVQYGGGDEASLEAASVEEIDVIATDSTDAQIVAELALLWHYEPEGKVILVQEIPQSTFHHFY